jgi:hypothetical protein
VKREGDVPVKGGCTDAFNNLVSVASVNLNAVLSKMTSKLILINPGFLKTLTGI